MKSTRTKNQHVNHRAPAASRQRVASKRPVRTPKASPSNGAELSRILEQREAELTILNSVLQALAMRKDMQEIYDLVGSRISALFDNQDVMIGSYDHGTEQIHINYLSEKGQRFYPAPSPFTPFARTLIRTKETVVLNHDAERRGVEEFGMVIIPGTQPVRSMVFVPLLVGETVMGFVSLSNVDRENAYSDSDARLLETLASSMSVALENARLFEAERRRNAELALINTVQQGLAKELDFQAVIDLVGDKIAEIFAGMDVTIILYDRGTDLLRYFYAVEAGERILADFATPPKGFDAQVLFSGQPLVINEKMSEKMEEFGSHVIPGTIANLSTARMPIRAGDQIIGILSLESNREHAFPEPTVNLLGTLAASLGIALQNARQFEEIKRLLDETQQRNAELGVISSVGQGLVREADFQGIIDLVGEKIREIFDAQGVTIRLYDPETNMMQYPFWVDQGQRLAVKPTPLVGFSAHIVKTRQPLLINRDYEQKAKELGSYWVSGGSKLLKSFAGVPILVGDLNIGVITLDSASENAFPESSVNLLTTLASNLGVALQNARRFDETKRLLAETQQRTAELQVINSVQQGLAAQLDMQAIYDLVGDQIRDLFDAQSVLIVSFDRSAGLTHFDYNIEKGQRFYSSSHPHTPFAQYLMRTKETVVINRDAARRGAELGMSIILGTESPRSMVFVPLMVGDLVQGFVSLQNVDREDAFGESDVRLLETLASSMSVAIENARLFEAERQRNAELALINTVQQGLAKELDFQAVIDLVGDKIVGIFGGMDVAIRLYDRTENFMHYPFVFEAGKRILAGYQGRPDGFDAHILSSRQVLVINEKMAERMAEFGSYVIPGTAGNQSFVGMPIRAGDQVIGILSLESSREHAFPESTVNLLGTLAASLGIALQNAKQFAEIKRLLGETQQRSAELQMINSVQQGLAAQLDIQAIYDLVGDKIRDIFDAQTVLIMTFDVAAQQAYEYYAFEKGRRDSLGAVPLTEFARYLIAHPETVLINEDMEHRGSQYGMRRITGDETKSGVWVPLMLAGEVKGVISLQNMDRENAFSESDVDLLETLASSMTVALENARLFAETNRLLAEMQQRAAELAIINSVQEGLASKLDMQAIYDLVGDKIRGIFDAQALTISTFDLEKETSHQRYSIEKGQRHYPEPRRYGSIARQMIRTRQPAVFQTSEEILATGVGVTPGTEPAKSAVYVPLIVGDQVRGAISLQNIDREYAFSESDVRLLQTLASSMSVALENARLFEAERQRAHELDIINQVGQLLAGQLDMQRIYDVVGDKLYELLDAHVVSIITYDREADLCHYRYLIEKGDREYAPPGAPAGFSGHILTTREPLLINRDVDRHRVELGGAIIAGNPAKSYLGVPLMMGGEARGVIALQNVDREEAFRESDLRLLTTLASSMSVALENARLFEETQRLLREMQQRTGELEIINNIQQGLASRLDMQTIHSLIGDKLRDIFDAQVVLVTRYDPKTNLSHFPYVSELGVRQTAKPIPEPRRLLEHYERTGSPVVINRDVLERGADYDLVDIGGSPTKSLMSAPLLVGGQVKGDIHVQNIDREDAFSDSDVRLLTTLASSMSVALENARLFEEETQRAAELATINRISEALSSQVELDTLIRLAGEQIRDTFHADIAYIALADRAAQIIRFPYTYGEQFDSLKWGEGLTSKIIESAQPLLINQDMEARRSELGATLVGTAAKTYLGVPIFVGRQAIGVISVQSTQEEGRFSEDDLHLLTTIAANVGLAIERARLYEEIQQRRQYFETLVKNSPVAIVTIDLETRVTEWNPAAERLFGYTRDEAVGVSIDELIARDAELHGEAARLSDEGLHGGMFHATTKRNRKDGSLVDVDLWGVPIIINGQRVGVHAIYVDIGELVRARHEAVSANQAKSAFLATMSHEIRTPMNAIIGMSGLLLDTPLNPEQREYADIIRGSGDTLLNIVNDILDFSKIEAGKMEMESQPFDLRTCVETSLDLVATRASEKGLDLAYIIEDDVPPAVIGDVTRLRQILINLLTNAIKFTEKGEVVLTVKDEGRRTPALQRTQSGASVKDEAGNQTQSGSFIPHPSSFILHFAVRDTGIGIAADRMDRLFQSFSQVDASTSRRYGGTGLGLAISKRLSEMMGGTMWAESEAGKGSTFHFTIVAPPAPDFVARPRILGERIELKGKRLLIVDDNATNRLILIRQTQNWGMLTRDTASPQEALDWICQGDPFDVAILDMTMPEMDGLALAGQIRGQRDARTLPIIISSSLGKREVTSHELGIVAFLAKPLKQSHLYDTLVGIFAHPTEQVPEVKPQFDTTLADRVPLRILLAEDNAVNQKLALRLLSQMGYRADVAGNGIEVLEALERQTYDVVLMDVQMPEMDGLEATRQIHTRWQHQEHPCIVAMTANAMQGDREMCLAAGMDDYVSKPIRVNELVEALTRCKRHSA